MLEAGKIVALGPGVRRLGGDPCSLAEISLFPNAGKTPARTSRTGRVGDAGLRWKNESGYYRRSCVENVFFRYKAIIGDRLRARHPKSQVTEAR